MIIYKLSKILKNENLKKELFEILTNFFQNKNELLVFKILKFDKSFMVIKKNSHEKCDGHVNCLSNEKDFETRSRNK